MKIVSEMTDQEYLENYAKRRKKNFSIKFKPTPHSDIDEVDISVTFNGYQFTTISYTPGELELLRDAIEKYLNESRFISERRKVE